MRVLLRWTIDYRLASNWSLFYRWISRTHWGKNWKSAHPQRQFQDETIEENSREKVDELPIEETDNWRDQINGGLIWLSRIDFPSRREMRRKYTGTHWSLQIQRMRQSCQPCTNCSSSLITPRVPFYETAHHLHSRNTCKPPISAIHNHWRR